MSAIEADIFEPDDFSEEERERFRIDNRQKASWAIRKLAQARQAAAENEALLHEELNRLGEWLKEANSEHVRTAIYFEAILHNWHQEQLEANPKAKTIKLPGGTLVARQNPDKLGIDDEQFIPWALTTHPEWVRTKHEPIKAEIKKNTKAGLEAVYDAISGDEMPGVEIIPGEMSWKAETE